MSKLPAVLLLWLLVGVLAAPQVAAAPAQVPGLPASISVASVPPTLPADGKSYNSIVVALKDASGNPSLAVEPLVVNLQSSQLNVGTVSLTVTIQPGNDYAVATMTTSNIPGSTEVTATSPGLLPGFVTVNTATPSGLASTLKVFSVPNEILPGGSGFLAVELQDDTGLPSKSTADVSVHLSSTNPGAAQLAASDLTIPAGQFFTEVAYTASGSLGRTTVSAFASGYTSGQGTINVVEAGSSGVRVQLSGIFASGSSKAFVLPADGQSYNALVVSLVDASGFPVPVPSSGLSVQLSSSKNTVVGVNGTVFMPGGSQYVITPLKTGILAGSSNITAFAQGYLGSAFEVDVVIPAPSKLAVFVDPSSKILTSVTNPLIVVQLQDASGAPARAKQDTSILVTSSNTSVVEGSLVLSIAKGEDFVSSFLQTTGVGSTILTASSSGLVSARDIAVSVIAFPISVSLSANPGSIRTNGTSSIVLSVHLLGEPLANANVTWLATGGTLSSPTSVTSSSGTASVTFSPIAVGTANVTALISSAAIGHTKATVFVPISLPPKAPPITPLQFVFLYGYLVVLPLVALLVYLVYYFRKRRKKAREELEAAFQAVG